MKLVKRGCTRTVILTGKYAIKLPCLHHSYAMFIEGIRANLNEGRFVKFEASAPIAKTFYSNCFGLCNIQERARHVRHRGLFLLDLYELCKTSDFFSEEFLMDDPKPENFGYVNRKLVKIDYGN